MSSKAPSSGAAPYNQHDAIYPNESYTVTIGAASTQSSALSNSVSVVRVFSTVDCFLKFGSNPTATTSDMFMPGGIVEYFGVDPNSKIAVIQKTSGGTLYITEGD